MLLTTYTKTQLKEGLALGMPIALGYISVSFAFGMMAAGGNLPIWSAVLISMTNLTSAGQLAGTQLLIAGAPYIEIAMTTFVINIRYFLMPLSLSQKLRADTGILKRMGMAIGITDEIFAVASGRKEVTPAFMAGLIALPYLGWALGTLVGATASYLLPQALRDALGIAIYGMFLAIIVPPCRKSWSCLAVVLTAVVCSCLFHYMPLLCQVPAGWRIIICAVAAAGMGAVVFPIHPPDEKTEGEAAP